MSNRQRSFRLGLATLLTVAPAMSFGAALGKLNVLSHLGEPLNAEVEIVSLKPGESKTLAPRLASREAHTKAQIPFDRALSEVRMSIGNRGGTPVLRLKTSRPVGEPYIRMLIELRSNAGRVVRPYTILLDPPAARRAAIKPKPAPQALPAKPDTAARAAAPTTGAPANVTPEQPKVPASREELFGDAPTPAAPQSREELFGVPAKPPASSRDELFGVPAKPPAQQGASNVQWRGFVQNYTAYDYKEPSHWSRAVVRTQLGAQGASGGVKWKATARVDLDPVYAGGDFYPDDVRKDQRADFFLRETYMDVSAGGLDFRLGKQHIVWGEMVGLFFADVVSARDQRDFILPNFEIIRIPQWAIRAEHFGENSHLEMVWLPVPDVDIIGKPGAEFYPVQAPPPAGFAQQFNNPERSPRNVRNSNFGLRASTLRSGWDLSAFYYRSTDVNPTFYREVVISPTPTVVLTPRHDRIWQLGGTLGKDLGISVLKAEMIYTSGRKFNVTRLDQPDGVVAQDTLDYVIGLDFTLGRDTRLNLQLFQKFFRDYDPDLIFDRHEDGASLLLSSKIGGNWEPEILVIRSLNRNEGLIRPRIGWIPATNWRVTFGVDIFNGPPTGFFGRFDKNDRAYMEVRRDF